MMKSFIFSFCLITTTCGSLRADWLNFRGPSGSGISTECAELTTKFTPESITWKIPLPGRGLGSPVVIGEKIIITASSGPEQTQLHVLCFSTKDGSQFWERKFWATGRTMCHEKTCVAAPTPASDGKTVFALFSSNDLVALDLEGNIKWMRGLTLDYPNASNSIGLSSSPIVTGDTLVVQIENDSESFAAGLDTASGLNRWKIDRPKAANWTSPVLVTVAATEIAALQSSKGLLGVQPTTGSSIFEYKFGADTIASSVASGDTIYIPSNGLTAVKATSDGAEVTKIWNEGSQRPATASPILIGDKIFTINGAGVLTCGNAPNGERLWRTRLTGPFSASPVAAVSQGPPHLYIVNEKGLLQCVDLSGAEGSVVSQLDLQETILATPSLSDNALYLRSDKHLWRIR